MSNNSLVEQLKFWRAERPDEWTMDEFIRDAEKLVQERNELAAVLVEVNEFCQKRGIGKVGDSASVALMQRYDELAAQVERLKHERDDALALVIRYQSLLECTIRGEEIIVGDTIVVVIDAELADEIEESFDESPKAALTALKAEWQADILDSMADEFMHHERARSVLKWRATSIRQYAKEADDE